MEIPKKFRPHLCTTLDQLEASFKDEWVPNMVMPVVTSPPNSNNKQTDLKNILTHVTGGRNQVDNLYFCSKDFPLANGFKGEGWSPLLKQLQLSAYASGFILVSNGKPFKNASSIVLICNHAQTESLSFSTPF